MAEEASGIATRQDFTIEEITLVRISGEEIPVYPLSDEAIEAVFHSLSFTESIFEPTVKGSILLRDVIDIFEGFKPIGGETIRIRAFTPKEENAAEAKSDAHKIDCAFMVYDVNKIANEATQEVSGQMTGHVIWKLDFCSPEYYLLKQDSNFLGDDFMGKISYNTSFVEEATESISDTAEAFVDGFLGENSFLGVPILGPVGGLVSLAENYLNRNEVDPESSKGLVQSLRDKYFSGDKPNQQMPDDNIEETINSIWLKKNHLMYPWGKDRETPDVFSTMDYLAENSISANNPNVANFLFYNTTKGYHFRSINSMIEKGSDVPDERKYKVESTGIVTETTPVNVASASEFDHLSLWRNGGYASTYTRVSPSFSDPYFDHVDFNESHKRTTVRYNYHDEFDNISHVEKYKLLPEAVETDELVSHELHDNIYGYFGEYYNNDKRHSKVTLLDYENGYGNDFGKQGDKTWQAMFDITPLSIDTLKKIKTIKQIIKANKREYARLRNLRNRFDTYECSVCCLSQTTSGITGASSVHDYGIVSAGSFSDVVNYEKEAEDGIVFRTSYDFSEGTTGPWNETLGEFFYQKEDPSNYIEYVINADISRFEITRRALVERLENCQSGGTNTPSQCANFDGELEGCVDCGESPFPCCECDCDKYLELDPDGEPKYPPHYHSGCVSNCQTLIQDIQDSISALDSSYSELVQHRDNFASEYSEQWNKSAFFISKDPEIEKLNSTVSSNSLYNVKSIKRLPIRGSRYEIFARRYNIRDDELGEWLYDAYLGNNPSIDPTEPGGHPIYDQRYMPFEVLGPGAYRSTNQRWTGVLYGDTYEYCKSRLVEDGYWDPDLGLVPAEYSHTNCTSCYPLSVGVYGGLDPSLQNIDSVIFPSGIEYTEGSACGNNIDINSAGYDPDFSNEGSFVYTEQQHGPPWGIVAPQWHPQAGEILLPGGQFNHADFSQRHNFFIDDIADYKPVSIKRAELESYVRIEFESPVGLDTLDEFPEGFIRDAGYEYFLPYLVMISPGPNGRHTPGTNIAVIGMDPYGFDVAIRKLADKTGVWEGYNEYENDNVSMNLYPTEEYETEEPYYTTTPWWSYWGGRNYTSLAGGTELSNEYTGDEWGYSRHRVRELPAMLWPSSESVIQESRVPFSYWNYRPDITTTTTVGWDWDGLWGYYQGNYSNYWYLWRGYHRDMFNTDGVIDLRGSDPRIGGQFGQSSGLRITTSLPSANAGYYAVYTNRYDGYRWYRYWNTNDELDTEELDNIGAWSYRNGWNRHALNLDFYLNEEEWNIQDISRISQSYNYYVDFPEDQDIKKELWKRDISGNTEYGLVETISPQNSKHTPLSFDRNFAAQFVVFSRNNIAGQCENYTCANPEGRTSRAGCPDDNPYCNCPAQDLIPRKERIVSREELNQIAVDIPEATANVDLGILGLAPAGFLAETILNANPNIAEAVGIPTIRFQYFIIDEEYEILEKFAGFDGAPVEQTLSEDEQTPSEWLEENGTIAEKPTDVQLKEALENTKECEIIEEVFDESWLGCMWSDLDSPISCGCPGRGENFKNYIEHDRTFATFWDTPPNAPLLRNAQMLQITAQQATMIINGDFSLSPGDIIELDISMRRETFDGDDVRNRSSGRWLVSEVGHIFATIQTHRTMVKLTRDSSHVPIEKAGFFDTLLSAVGSVFTAIGRIF